MRNKKNPASVSGIRRIGENSKLAEPDRQFGAAVAACRTARMLEAERVAGIAVRIRRLAHDLQAKSGEKDGEYYVILQCCDQPIHFSETGDIYRKRGGRLEMNCPAFQLLWKMVVACKHDAGRRDL